jgi:hypothetical protein
MKAELIFADLLRRQTRLDEAQKLAKYVFSRTHARDATGLHDSRELAELEAQAIEQLAAVATDRGELPVAAELFRQALSLRQENLLTRQRPVAFFAGLSERNKELPPSYSYAETQLRLAHIVKSQGRIYEAEQLLGECMITGYVLCNNDQAIALRYLLLYGSTYDAAADLLAGERPQEGELMRRSADYVWQALVSNYPQAVDRADLPVAVRDRLKWHRENSALDQPERALSLCQKFQQGQRSPVPITPFCLPCVRALQLPRPRLAVGDRFLAENVAAPRDRACL